MNTAKSLAFQYDFKTAIPLEQAVKDYFNPDMEKAQILKRANAGNFPFPVYRAEPDNKKSGWYVNIVSLAKWLDEKKAEAELDCLAMS